MEKLPQVVITGVSGYIGAWVAKAYLDSGKYRVRGTVRGASNKDRLKPMLEGIGENSKNLELVSADLMDAESLVKACEDCDILVHVASPNLIVAPKDENEVLGPAIQGTENAINACFKNNVKRIIVTSTCLALIDWNKDHEADETQWREIDRTTPLYDRSKILAEKKAFEMVNNPPEGKKLELVTILPALVLGRPLFKSMGTSLEIFSSIFTGKFPKVPCVHTPVVHVEDIANAHLLAATAPAGERYAIVEGTHKLVEIGQVLAPEFKKYGYKVADKEMGYCLAKMLSCCVKELAFFVSIWDKRRPINNEKSIKMLGLKSYKSFDETCVETAWALIKLGLIEDKTKGK